MSSSCRCWPRDIWRIRPFRRHGSAASSSTRRRHGPAARAAAAGDGAGGRLDAPLRGGSATAPTWSSFPKRDSTHWRSASWRDSDAGYARGRFAMDVNAIWAPQALEAIGQIRSLAARSWDSSGSASIPLAPDIAGTPLAEYWPDSASLRRAIDIWQRGRAPFRGHAGAGGGSAPSPRPNWPGCRKTSAGTGSRPAPKRGERLAFASSRCRSTPPATRFRSSIPTRRRRSFWRTSPMRS